MMRQTGFRGMSWLSHSPAAISSAATKTRPSRARGVLPRETVGRSWRFEWATAQQEVMRSGGVRWRCSLTIAAKRNILRWCEATGDLEDDDCYCISAVGRLNTVDVLAARISDTSSACKAPFPFSSESQPCLGHRHKTPKAGLLAPDPDLQI
jgi:hypothetical protein